jgi:hypothetical protein
LAKAARVAGGTASAAKYLGAGERIAQGFGVFTEAEVAAGIGTAAVFDGAEQRLSNLIQQYPALANPVTAFIAADPSDSKAEGKLKLALEGLGFSALMQPFVLGLRALRAARAAKAKSAPGELADRESALEQSPSGDELSQNRTAAEGLDEPKENPFPDRELIEDTGHPFTMVRRKRWTTNQKLKRDWEAIYGKDWPTDANTGRDMEVHHVIPLADGGPDHVSNIVPVTREEHIGIHKESGDPSRWAKRKGKKIR